MRFAGKFRSRVMTSPVCSKPRFLLWLPALLPVIWWISLSVGAYPLAPGRVMELLVQGPGGGMGVDVDHSVLFSIRLPRVMFGAVAGMALALGGVCMQALFRNPLADPGLMGLSSGAALAAACVTLFASTFPVWLGHPLSLPIAAFLGGLAVTAAVYRVSNRGGRVRVDSMLLMGIAVNALCGALIGLLLVVADDAQLRHITFWSFGSLGRADMGSSLILGAAMLPAVWGVWRLRDAMNLLLSGEADAASLGVRVERLKLSLVALSCWMVSLVVAWAGLIGFVGLVIPHIARLAFGASHRTLAPAAMVLGAAFLPAVDMVCRTAMAPAELPIGMVTALLGTPFFLFLLIRREARI